MLTAKYSARNVFGALTLMCLALIGYAFYAQYVLNLQPCPLCMFQRVAVILVGVVSLVAALHGPLALGSRVYTVFGLLFSLLGAAIAGRHVWLQSLPKDQLPSCAPPLDYMWDNFPFGSMLKTILMTSGECANIDWTLFGFSMPVWTLVWFVGVSAALLVILVYPPGRSGLARI
jgi:disulfide bond formation protein DsbB